MNNDIQAMQTKAKELLKYIIEKQPEVISFSPKAASPEQRGLELAQFCKAFIKAHMDYLIESDKFYR
jgi:hypothetical protein